VERRHLAIAVVVSTTDLAGLPQHRKCTLEISGAPSQAGLTDEELAMDGALGFALEEALGPTVPAAGCSRAVHGRQFASQ